MSSYCERSLESMSPRIDVISIAGKDYGPNCDLLESDLPDDLLKEAIQSEYSILSSSTIPGINRLARTEKKESYIVKLRDYL